MPVLFEINHPAHIHLFRNLSEELKKKDINTLFLIKSEPVIERLAAHYNLQVIKMGKKGKGLSQKYFYQLFFLIRSVMIVMRKKTKLSLGVSMNLPMVSKFTKMNSIGFDDDDMAVTPVFAKYANRASVILTPSALAHEQRGAHHITYPGYHELAYLHPKRFSPDKTVLDLLGLKEGDPWFLVRFNAFAAHHDIGEGGMNHAQKEALVGRLMARGKVFISSEAEVDPEYHYLLLPDRPELMHSFLALATMVVGESQTMTSEAAVLGTPAVKCNTFAERLSVPNELENKYGLCYSFLPENYKAMLEKIGDLLDMPDLKTEWQRRRERMLADRIDVTGFFAWFVEHYPVSVNEMKNEGEGIFDRFR